MLIAAGKETIRDGQKPRLYIFINMVAANRKCNQKDELLSGNRSSPPSIHMSLTPAEATYRFTVICHLERVEMRGDTVTLPRG